MGVDKIVRSKKHSHLQSERDRLGPCRINFRRSSGMEETYVLETIAVYNSVQAAYGSNHRPDYVDILPGTGKMLLQTRIGLLRLLRRQSF